MFKVCKTAFPLFCLFAFALFAREYALAQIETGSVTGTVKDSSGAVMRGVRITLTGDATGVSQAAKSTSTGTYVFDAVTPGQYTIQATAAGFKTSVVKGLTVNVQQTLTIDVTLEPGGSTMQVVVTTKAPLLQTENGALGQTVDSEMVNDLPLVGRDWVSLAQIAAGVATAPVAEPSTDAGTTGSAYFSVNGVNMWQNDIRLNGINDNIEMYGGATLSSNATVTPPPDAIQQFRLQAGDFNAQYGHSTGGVINAVTKSGTNEVHGDVWDYLRSNVLEANSYFLKQAGQPIAPYRQNVFGGTLGGPIVIPKIYDGRNKTFFFISYQGFRTLETYSIYSPSTNELFNVPTALEQSSNFTNLQDIITDTNGATNDDSLNRVFPEGTVMDPATTRTVAGGATDPVSGIKNPSSSAITVRDPFYTNGSIAGKTNFTGLTQYLNMLPASRQDPNAVALLHNYPLPTVPGVITDNYLNNPQIIIHQDQEDARVDHTFGPKDTGFISGDFSRVTVLLDSFLPGILIGEGVNGEENSYPVWAAAIGYNHIFSPTLFNEFHIGYDHFIEDVRSDYGDILGIPEQFGIQGIPQIPNNGGLPPIDFSSSTGDGIQEVGVHTSTPTLETIHALEFMENLTKEHAAHLFKMGYQIDFIGGDIIQPPAGHGEFTYNGQYSSATNDNRGYNGIADALLTPIPSTLPATDNPEPYDEGGVSTYQGSNYSATDDTRHYMGAYLQDDWKILPTLTLNLGVRWDYYPPYNELYGRQANFVEPGGNGPGGTFYIPKKTCNTPMSSGFTTLLAEYNIQIDCTNNLGTAQKANFAPRIGFNWRLNPTIVLRGGYGIAYGALANLGYGGTLGTNYPFVYTIDSPSTNSSSVPLVLSNRQTATMENVFTTVDLSNPTEVNGSGLDLYGRQYNFQTPYVETSNLTLQEQLTAYDAFQIVYVGNLGRHLDNIDGQHNSPTEIIKTGVTVAPYLPLPEFAQGSAYETTVATSNYNALQATYQHDFHAGVELIGNYTWSKCLSDQQTEARGGNLSYRGYWVVGFGIKGDYGLCDVDAADIIHVAGTYQLPFGRGREYGANISKTLDAFLGGWAVNFIASYQSGQPFTLGCEPNPTANAGCDADVYKNIDMFAGAHTQKEWLNPDAFYNPPTATTGGSVASLGGKNQQARSPSFFNLDSSIFKNFTLPGQFSMQFRAEAFNTLNSAEFAAPPSSNLDYTTLVNFGEITSLRHGPRIIQLALKVFY